MRALREIEALAVDDDDRPLQTVEILECGQLTEAEIADFVSLQDARRKAHSRSRHGSSSGSGKVSGFSPAALRDRGCHWQDFERDGGDRAARCACSPPCCRPGSCISLCGRSLEECMGGMIDVAVAGLHAEHWLPNRTTSSRPTFPPQADV